jgi:neutral ceramidase
MKTFRAGAAKRKITPPVGTELFGYIRRLGSSTGIHDPLWANLLWVEDGNLGVLLVSLDVLNFSDEFAAQAKSAISKEIDVAEQNICIAAIHTHSAPGAHFFRGGGKRNRAWEKGVLDLLIDGSREARQNSRSAYLGLATDQAFIGYNRRKSENAIDSHLTLACFADDKKRPFCVVASYGCHPVVLKEDNLLVSADYVGYFRERLNKLYSADMVTLFFTGATGDVDPIDRGGFEIADKLAGILAQKALAMIKNMSWTRKGKLRVEKIKIIVPYERIPSLEEVKEACQKAKSLYRQAKTKGDRTEIKIQKAFLDWAEELRESAATSKIPSSLECELQCFKLEDLVLVAHPFELFSSLSLEIRELSKVKHLIMAGYANGYHGYLPDEKSAREGGYEVEEAYKYVGLLPYSTQAGQIFQEKALEVIESVVRRRSNERFHIS